MHLASALKAGQATVLSQPQALSGLGGVGKTQVAVEYAYQHRQDYQAVFWTPADRRESLVSGYITIARLLNLPEKDEQDQANIIEAVMHWLTTHTEWLLILDNANDLTVVHEFIPPVFGGRILLTTRAQAMGRLARGIEINTMPTDIGALFLLRRALLLAADAPLEDAATADVATAREICKEMGGLPLALDQAGSYIEEVLCSLQDYRRLYQIRRSELLKKRGGIMPDHPESVATTWSLAFQRVEQSNPAASDLLRLCAFLHPDAIPEEIIIKGKDVLGPTLASLAKDPIAFDNAIAALRAYSLIQRNARDKMLNIHCLVQAALKDAMNEQTCHDWILRAIQAVTATFPEPEFNNWPQCEQTLPHALASANLIETYALDTVEAALLLNRTGHYLYQRGQPTQVESLYLRALAIREQVLGKEHPETASSLDSLAYFYYDREKYEQAEPLWKRALAIREQVLGKEHPEAAIILDNLAYFYVKLGKYEQAESLYQRALAIHEQVLGKEHPDTQRVRSEYVALLKFGMDRSWFSIINADL